MFDVVNKKIADRYNGVMEYIGCESSTIDTKFSELDYRVDMHGFIKDKIIDVAWLVGELEYWFSCYYEKGNCRCDDRFISKDDYKIWLKEKERIKRCIKSLEKYPMETVVAYVYEVSENENNKERGVA